MKVVFVFAALVAFALARPQNEVQVRSQTSDLGIGLGDYSFAYELSDGTSRQETGELRDAGTENEVQVIRGSYSYVSPDGSTYTVEYVADENGFQPKTSHVAGRK